MISVIIVNYNSGDILCSTVLPLLASSHVNEIIVVDNASTDHSMEAVEGLATAQTRLKCIHNEKNLGFAKACNIGIALAGKSDYLLFLNPDCRIEHGALEKLVDCLKKFTHAGMAGPLILNPDGTEQAGGRRAVPTPWRAFVHAFGLFRFAHRWPRLFADFNQNSQALPDAPVMVEAISGACMMVKRSALESVGLLDEGYFLHCEDLDWCMRFRQNGWKIMFVPEAEAIHYQGSCSKGRQIIVEWHKHKGMIRFYRKFFRHQYPGILFWLVILGVWLRFVLVCLYHKVYKSK